MAHGHSGCDCVTDAMVDGMLEHQRLRSHASATCASQAALEAHLSHGSRAAAYGTATHNDGTAAHRHAAGDAPISHA